MTIINDNDLLVIDRGGTNHKYTGQQLKSDIQAVSPTPPTPGLDDVVKQGATTLSKPIFKAGFDTGDGIGTVTFEGNGLARLRGGAEIGQGAVLTVDGAGTLRAPKNYLEFTIFPGSWRQVYMNQDGFMACGGNTTIIASRSSDGVTTPVEFPDDTTVLSLVDLVNTLKTTVEQLEAKVTALEEGN